MDDDDTKIRPSLLDELDRRQNDVIRQLDLLSDEIVKVLESWTRSELPFDAAPHLAEEVGG